MPGTLRPLGLILPLALGMLLPAANAAAATLAIGSVEVRTTKEDGKTAWDVGGGAPDLKVSVQRVSKPKGEKHTTATQKDTFKATFNRKALDVDAGDEIEIRVLDEDLNSDDEVGKITLEITAEMLKSGEKELAFGQVNKLRLRFEK